MSKDITVTLPEELGEYLLSAAYGDLLATETFLAKDPGNGGPEHPEEEGEALRDRIDAKAVIHLLSVALGHTEEDHLRDCREPGSSPLCEDYDCIG